MNWDFKNRYWFLGIATLFLFFAFFFFTDIIIYVLISFILSIIGQPLMDLQMDKFKFKKIKIGSALAAINTMIIFLLLFGAFIYFFVPLVVEQAVHLADLDYEVIGDALAKPLHQFQDRLSALGINSATETPTEMVSAALKDWFDPQIINDFIRGIFSLTGNIVMGLFSVLFITFFFLQNQGMFQSFILALVPSTYENKIRHILADTIKLLTRYFGGVLIQMTIITIFLVIFLSILGIKHALLIAFFAAMINVIPYLGPIMGFLFGVLVTISGYSGMDFTALLPLFTKLAIAFGSMQLLDNFLLQPYIFSNSVRAHPLEIFIVILIAGKLGGVVGMILAIPSYTMLRVVARAFLSEFKIVQKLTQSIDQVD